MRIQPLSPLTPPGAGDRLFEPATAYVAVSPVTAAAANLLRLLRRLVAAGVRLWPITLPAVVVLDMAGHIGVLPVLGLLAPVGVTLAVWRRRSPASFHRLVAVRLAAVWRREWTYRRTWQPAMLLAGLAQPMAGRWYLPKLGRIETGEHVDRLTVRLLAGQCPAQVEAVTDQLAHTFGATRCRVRTTGPGRVRLEFTRHDRLTAPVPALPVPDEVDFTAVPVGLAEDGSPWLLSLLGNHLLIAGATGSGKGSVVWSLLRALAEPIHFGLVRVWGLDPKGGMELSLGAPLFTRLAYADPGALVALLEDAVAVLRARADRLRQLGIRRHEPSVALPLILLVVDELAALTAYVGDRELKRRAELALQLLLSQGRACGVLVVAAVQDPGKDVVGFRDLFPLRVGLRLVEDVQVDMALGRGARRRGAECDRIPANLPGVGYVLPDGAPEAVRVRAGWVTDGDLTEMCARWPAPTDTVGVVL
jgi:S-DNA-T family DNA segregation ATPase FtsK/SpoIIIE